MNVSGRKADEICETEQHGAAKSIEPHISRRMAMGGVAFFGAAMSAISSRALAQPGAAPGSYSNSAIAAEPPGDAPGKSEDEIVRAVKIARAMRSGPPQITRDATIAEMDHQGNVARVLRKGTNGWLCMPGDENRIGAPPMCVDELGMQWFKDAMTGQPKPTNKAPGLCYMLCGATQHSNTDVHDQTSPAIPIGPHWMILWPFDAAQSGLPTTVRDAGAWIMFAGTLRLPARLRNALGWQRILAGRYSGMEHAVLEACSRLTRTSPLSEP